MKETKTTKYTLEFDNEYRYETALELLSNYYANEAKGYLTAASDVDYRSERNIRLAEHSIEGLKECVKLLNGLKGSK